MKNIAIIGSGISGLTSAYLLNQKHQVTVFEKNNYIGGHTATIDFKLDGQDYSIDTGFIVFNNKTYPNFLKLMAQIGMDRLPTEMSFSVKHYKTGLEYNGNNLNSLFAQRSNLFSITFWRLIRSILRFNKLCKALYESGQYDESITLGDFLDQNNFSDYFCGHYILPMGAAIWSTSITEMRKFQLKFFIQFFHNHGLLNISDRPQWYVIPGGSKNYIPPLTEKFKDRIHLNSAISSIERTDGKVTIHFADQESQVFDDVVFACHSDQALSLLADATDDEQAILGDIPYAENDVVLHTDTSILPKRKLAWASWNYYLTENNERPATVTY
ncbi:MAG: FAD-dependent oxidoreductase, partial [Kangiellaceae bacterium]|nr:FAD-dependent oxidoreductase [Kangiellaceae bacterium]